MPIAMSFSTNQNLYLGQTVEIYRLELKMHGGDGVTTLETL